MTQTISLLHKVVRRRVGVFGRFLGGALLIGLLGLGSLQFSGAATYAVPKEVEGAALAGQAASTLATNASAGAAVRFGTAPAGYSVTMTDFGAKCNGSANDRPALEASLANLTSRGGGTLLVPPGNCLIVQGAGGGGVALGSNISVQGMASTSTLSLFMTAPGAYEKIFIVSGQNIALKNLRLERASAGPAIMLYLQANVANFTLDRVVMDGHYDARPQEVHGIFIADTGTYRQLKLLNSTFTKLHFGLLMTNAATSTVSDVTVDTCTFTQQYADDLEFNSPMGKMSNINVLNSRFTNNQWKDPSAAAGIGLGFANVQTGVIKNNYFNGYYVPPLHIEDRSSNIDVVGNTLENGAKGPFSYASYIFVLSHSHDVRITGNIIDTSANTNTVYAVFAAAGGPGIADPYNITASGNTFRLRPQARASLGTVTLEANTVINLP